MDDIPNKRDQVQLLDGQEVNPTYFFRLLATSGPIPIEWRLLDTCNVIGYITWVIKSFKHKGLERYFRKGSTTRIRNEHAKRLRLILARLQAAMAPKDMNLPGLRLHELKGRQKGRWSVWVSGNWRVTFKFEGVDAVAVDVDYEDYH